MCLAVPGKVISLDGEHARIEYRGGVVRNANISLVSPSVGQYVIVHAGFAIQVLKEEDALENLALWDEMLEAYESEGGG